jgi:hypothetical protein
VVDASDTWHEELPLHSVQIQIYDYFLENFCEESIMIYTYQHFPFWYPPWIKKSLIQSPSRFFVVYPKPVIRVILFSHARLVSGVKISDIFADIYI